MAIALVSHALVSLAEVHAALFIDDDDQDERLNLLINRITEAAEAAVGRDLVSDGRGALTEFYTLERYTANLYLRVLPIISVTSVHESYLRTYDADSLLTEGTDFLVYKETGKLVRTHSATQEEESWEIGLEAEKVVYTGGYATTADVPYTIKDAALSLASRMYRDSKVALEGAQNLNDATGTTTLFPMAMMTKELRRELEPFVERAHFVPPRRG